MTSRTIDIHCAKCRKYLFSLYPDDIAGIAKDYYCNKHRPGVRTMQQPFYHRVDGLLFTSTSGFSEEQFVAEFVEFADSKKAKDLGIVSESVEVEPGGYQDPEAGDPADL